MAKDREGSVNIYGAMQAKTAQGIVAYTDGIAHENNDGTVITLDELLKNGVGGGSAIVDVDKLVYSSWIGTSLVDGQYLEKLYFNNNLSVEEVVEKVKNFTLFPVGNDVYVMAFFAVLDENNETDMYNTYVLAKVPFSSSINVYLIGTQSCLNALTTGIFTENDKILFSSMDVPQFGLTSGWNTTINNPININKVITVVDEYINESSILSSTKFTKSEEPKDDVFYRVTSKGGEVVPNTGYVEKVYLNTSLSVENVVSICETLNFADLTGSGNLLCPVFSNQDSSKAIFLAKLPLYNDSSKYRYTIEVIDSNGYKDVFYSFDEDIQSTDFYGWLEDFDGVVNINDENIISLMGYDNESVKEIFSITPYTSSPSIYSYKNGEYKQILQQGDFEQQEGNEYIEITADSIDTITITQDVYDSINSKDNVVVRLIVDDGSNIKTTLLLYKSNIFLAEATNTSSIVLFSFSSMEGVQLPLNSVTFLIINSDLTHIYKSIDIANPFIIESFTISNDKLLISGKKSTGSNFNYGVNIDTTPTSGSSNLISSKAVYTSLQSYAKKTEVNQMIADYITTNFENGDEGSY